MTWVHDVKVYTVFSLSARNFRRKGGALVGLYIAALAVSRILSGLFIWEAKFDITCNQWIPLGPSSCRIMCFSFLLIWVCGVNKMILFFLGDISQRCLKNNVLKKYLAKFTCKTVCLIEF